MAQIAGARDDSIGALAQRSGLDPSTLSRNLRGLERAGLVRRRRNPRDGRGVLAEITESGREVVRPATADLLAVDFGMTAYGEAELTQLFELLRTLRVAAGDFPQP